MRINNCTLNVFFQRNAKVRESIFELEESLVDFQKPFTLVPMPADSPAEFPRIVAATIHGHTQMMISEKNVQMVISFDDNYNNSIDDCINYMRDKCKNLNAVLPTISDYPSKGLYYVGISLQLSMDKNDGIDKPIQYLVNNFVSLQTKLTMEEIGTRVALVKDDKYYINLNMNNNKIYCSEKDERGSFAGIDVKDDVLNIFLDVNDRYAFNEIVDYKSSFDEIENIASIIEDVVKNRLQAFIKDGGIYND